MTSSQTWTPTGTEKFTHFVDLCCQGYNVLRKNSNVLLNLFNMMAMAGIPGVTSEAVKYIQEKLESDLSDDEASRTFTRCVPL